MNDNTFEYTGYVEVINIKGVGPGSHEFLFRIANSTGDKRWLFALDHVSEPLRYTAMVNLLTAVYASNTMVALNTAPNPGGQPFAAEIEVVRSRN
jgi:hypothetical protein